MAKILLVEDDLSLAKNLSHLLGQEAHVVDHAGNCGDGRHYARSFTYDLAIFDWELPDGSGADLCKELRQSGLKSPIIMLTGRKQLEDRVAGLDCGADDYMCKPCEPEELCARIRALLRRTSDTAEIVCVGSVRLDLSSRSVLASSNEVKLTPSEFDICELLMRNPDVSLEPDTLVARLSINGTMLSRSAVKVYISNIRKKFTEVNRVCPIVFRDKGYSFCSSTASENQ